MKKSIMIRVKHNGEIIKYISPSYPSHLNGIINEEKYKNIISSLNNLYSSYNYKPLIICIGLLILGIACITMGGVSVLFLKGNQSDYSKEIQETPSITLFIVQTVLFSLGGIFLLNSFVFLFYIKKKPISNIKEIKEVLDKLNIEFLQKEITFSLEFEENQYYFRLIFPSSIPFSQKTYSEDIPLLKQQQGSSYNNSNITNTSTSTIKQNTGLVMYDPSYSSDDNDYDDNDD